VKKALFIASSRPIFLKIEIDSEKGKQMFEEEVLRMRKPISTFGRLWAPEAADGRGHVTFTF
jgi:hypothetical protein